MRILLEKVFDILFAVPMWITIVGILGVITRYFMGTVVLYNITESKNENGKVIEVRKTNPEQVYRYKWKSSDASVVLGAVLLGGFVAITIATIMIIF